MKYDGLINDILKQNKLVKISEKVSLTNYQIAVLEKYQIPYKQCNSIQEIIYYMEEYLEVDNNAEDLENVSKSLSEIDYYNNYKK